MKIILNNTDKEGVTYDFCFSWRNGYCLCICHEVCLKKRYTLNINNLFCEPWTSIPWLFCRLKAKIVLSKRSVKIGKV
jgi:hypothetical protein